MNYFALEYLLDGISRTLIWCTDLEGDAADFVLTDSHNDIATFSDDHNARNYSHRNGLQPLERARKVYNIDHVNSWVSNPVSTSTDCCNALDYWNLLGDIVATFPEKTSDLDDMLNSRFLGIYDRLFYGSNLPAITPAGEAYLPEWDVDDITSLQLVFNSGTSVFRDLLGVVDRG